MTLKRLLRTTMTALAVLASAGVANAITTAQAGPWNSTSTWAGGVVPGCNDAAVLNHDVSIGNSVTANANTLTINSGKKLTISGSGVLQMCGTNSGGLIDGTLNITDGGTFATASTSSTGSVVVSSSGEILMDGSTTAPTLTINAVDVVLDNSGTAKIVVDTAQISGPEAVINGSGNLRGQALGDTIAINDTQGGYTVQLKLDGATIRGTLTILNSGGVGVASFDNQGFVVADDVAGAALVLDSSLDVVTDTANSCANARWQATAACPPSVLQFDTPGATALASEFRILGRLVIGAYDVTTAHAANTSGYLYVGTYGQLDASSTGKFYFGGTCSGTCASTPSSPFTGTFTCSNCP